MMGDNADRHFAEKWSARCAALLAFCACLAHTNVPASAHPLGNFTINHIVKVRQAGDSLQIRYVLDMAEIPTFAVMRSRSASGKLDAAGLRSWADSEIAGVTAGLVVQADGASLRLISTGLPRVSTRSGAGGLPTLYWVGDFVAYAGRAHSLLVDDTTFPDRIGWKDVVIAPAVEPTGELTHYPTAMLSSPRDVSSASLTRSTNGRWVASSIATPAAAAAAPASQARSNALADMLARGPSNIVVVLLTLLAAIGLGALHALEPGHGKTLLAVSLVGARATSQQALMLAAALTLAHTAGVICLGLALLIAAPWIVPETVYPWLTTASGLAVACLGASALARFVRSRRGARPTIKVGPTEQAHTAERRQADRGHALPTIKVGTTDHDHDHGHEHGHEHGHTHDHGIRGDEPISFRGVVLIAMSGNVAPCPAALVVMLAALASHQLVYGLAVIVAFGVGLAAVLTGLGIAVVRGATTIARRLQLQRIAAYGPLASACVISCIGAVLFAQGLASGIIRAPGWPVILLTLSAIAGYAMRPGHAHTHTRPHVESPNAA
jgi:ABC-type nickel/cobalt efflux system permease component RcnA